MDTELSRVGRITEISAVYIERGSLEEKKEE